jgi:DNA-binding response OmpR family regulator
MSNRVAIIEDDLSIALMYKSRLESAGYTVRNASNGEEGLALCEEFKPELILLDLRMPIMHGDAMLQKLRETEWGSEIKVIILTNISRDEAPSILRFLNVDRYIVKAHYTPHQVTEVVEDLLKPTVPRRH